MPLPEIRTVIFATLALDSVFYAFSCKNLRKNIWQYNPFSNLYLVGCVIFSSGMLFLAIYFPFSKFIENHAFEFLRLDVSFKSGNNEFCSN